MRPDERGAVETPPRVRGGDTRAQGLERRRASGALWQACEALLSAPADPEALDRALEALRQAFECDGVALHARGPDGTIEPWCACGSWRTEVGDLRDCMTVPLLRGAERTGTLDLLARPGQRFRPAQLGLVRAASGALGAALGSRLELDRLRHAPGRDPVTGLPDPAAFRQRLDQEVARVRGHGPALGLLVIEIDHVEALERRYGRPVTDAVLGEAALVLKLALRETDVLARLDAGRFVVALPETDPGAALRCGERVRRTLEEHPFARVGHVSVRAGLATSPRDGVDPTELMDRVERALALARKSPRRRVATLEPTHAH